MNDDVNRAVQDMEAALVKLRNAKAGKMTAGLEAVYGNAYQKLVRLGVRPQIKGKYRG
jgi:hypothetical protein